MDSNEQILYSPWKWLPTPDKYIPTTQMKNVGGFAFDTHGNVHRNFISSTTSITGFSVSAYQKKFNEVSFTIASRTGSTSGYWYHALTYLFGYNDIIKIANFQSLTSLEHIVIMNMGRKDYGDRIKEGSLKVRLNNLDYLNNRITFNTGQSGLFTEDLNYDWYVDASDSSFATNVPASDTIDIVSVTSATDYRISDTGITGQPQYIYFYPYYSSNNEFLVYDRSITPNVYSRFFMGKLFPYDGLAIFYDQFSSTAQARIFIDSITAVEWDTDIVTTEFHAYCIKEPFILNYTTNPSLFKVGKGYYKASGTLYSAGGINIWEIAYSSFTANSMTALTDFQCMGNVYKITNISVSSPTTYIYTDVPTDQEVLNEEFYIKSDGIGDMGYSYGRDGLTGNSGEFINSVSSISTYATTIGLYNNYDELLFVAKLPQAIKLIKELPYSFVVNVDFRIK